MLLQCSNISKTFVSEPVLSNVSFFIEENEKAAIVGINGAGKSTLLKIIAGELSSDNGIVTLQKGATIGYLSQQEAVSGGNTIYQEVMSAKAEVNTLWDEIKQLELDMKNHEGAALNEIMDRYSTLNHRFEELNGYALVSEVTGILKGLGFDESEFDKRISDLSGGQKTRVALSKLLLTSPDLIMLDEPTNHLDIDSITWLEGYLKGYKGAVIIVAHDRYFLDRIVTKVIEIERTKCEVYKGNYTEYAAKKDFRRQEQLRMYMKQQADIAHQEAVIEKLKSFNREKSIKRAESREKMLDKIERIDKPIELSDSMKIKITPSIESGNDVLSIKELSKAFGNQLLFNDLSLELKKGERVALIGKNGTGKTTILKIINDGLTADKGSITLGAKVHIGYYDQEHQVLSPEKTLFQEISDAYPDLDNTKIRNTLAAFLFTGDDVFKQIKDLSGGERGRVSLAKLMLSHANLLILDEPTNHLDITSKEILEDALNSYAGTVLYVSHDRYFVNKTCTRICELVDGRLTNCEGSYDYYMEKRDDIIAKTVLLNSSPLVNDNGATIINTAAKQELMQQAKAESKLDYAAQKQEKARIKKLENELSKCEQEIEDTENAIASLEEEMSDPAIATNSAKLGELSIMLDEKNSLLLELMEKWEKLSEELK